MLDDKKLGFANVQAMGSTSESAMPAPTTVPRFCCELPEPSAAQALRAREIERVEGRCRSGAAAGYKAKVERVVLLRIELPAHMPRFTESEVEQAFEPDK
ncbi:hypothetical protein [Bradyrhizobium sp. RT9b]|uniref:hypothetical protein n=1 Tax=Bradyrhizobium sp. RT9b TaxID=3156385 RepID=UPI00339B8831